MRVSVIKSDKFVTVDGKAYGNLDMSTVPADVVAMQWFGTYGELEHAEVDGVKPPNTRIDSDALFQPLIAAWQVSADAEANYVDPEPEITLEDKAKLARLDRDELLKACDWTQLPDIPEATHLLWQPYRQALRDITLQPGFPETIDWPVAP